MEQVILQCSLCDFRSHNLLQIGSHLITHPGNTFVCGIYHCPRICPNLPSLRAHLRSHHSDFYPRGDYQAIEFSQQSFCKLAEFGMDSPAHPENSHFPDLDISQPSLEFEPDLPDQRLPPDFDAQIESKKKEFIQSLVLNGSSLPFKNLKSVVDSVLDIISAADLEGLPLNETLAELKNSISSSERFDGYIEEKFNGIYPEMVSIANSDKEFASISFEKSLKKQLSYFDSPSDFSSLGDQNSSEITSFFDSESCHRQNCIYISLFMDDFQLANPLLSKKACDNEMKAIYYRVLTPGTQKNSKRHFTQLLGLCKTSTFKQHSSDIMLYFAQEFNDVKRTGVMREFSGTQYQFDLDIGYFSFDSKEASYLIGLKLGFTHQYCCRFCILSRNQFSLVFSEDDSLLRTPQNLIAHFNNATLDPQSELSFGIQRNSLLRFFDFENPFFSVPPCIGHDFYEGVVPKVLTKIFSDLVSRNSISNNTFKQRVNALNLAEKDKYSFPAINFQAPKLRLTMNESYYLLRFLPFLIHDCFPENDPSFEILKMLNEISSIISGFKFTFESIAYLKTLIADFLALCVSNYPSMNITIKFHHMVHYPGIILKFGPLRHISTINFESHHSFLKSLMRSSRNWTNTALTIATKYARFTSVFREDNQSSFVILLSFMLPPQVQQIVSNDVDTVRSYSTLHHNGIKYCLNQCLFYKKLDEIDFFIKLEGIYLVNSDFLFYGTIQRAEPLYEISCLKISPTPIKGQIFYNQIENDFRPFNIYRSNAENIIFEF